MNGTKITMKLFKAVKILIDAGETQAKIADYLNISKATVGRISVSESYEEYQTMVAEKSAASYRAMKAKAKRLEEEKPAEAKPQNVTVPYYVTQKLDSILETLKLISNKLAFVVDELTK